jgi:dienelactone hydrolase
MHPALYAVARWSSLPWLHRVQHPSLIVAGEEDPTVPLRNARLLAARLPNARLHVVNGGGHLFLLDEPQTSWARFAPSSTTAGPLRSQAAADVIASQQQDQTSRPSRDDFAFDRSRHSPKQHETRETG